MKVIFLDRDGTINVDDGYVFRVEDWRFTDHAIDALRMLRAADYRVAVVTNQSGIAAGLYSENDVRLLHAFAEQQLADEGTRIDAWAFCPHSRDDGCVCRKPNIGMARDIERQLGGEIDYAQSWTIGDKPSDIEFGRALGTGTVLLRSKYWDAGQPHGAPSFTARSLYEAARSILEGFRDTVDYDPR